MSMQRHRTATRQGAIEDDKDLLSNIAANLTEDKVGVLEIMQQNLCIARGVCWGVKIQDCCQNLGLLFDVTG